MTPPAAAPCTLLPTKNTPSPRAEAHTTLPTAKITITHSKTGLRPKISESEPQMGVDAAPASRYDEPIQV